MRSQPSPITFSTTSFGQLSVKLFKKRIGSFDQLGNLFIYLAMSISDISAEIKRTFLPVCCTPYSNSSSRVVLPTPGAPAAITFVPGKNPPSLDINLSNTVLVFSGSKASASMFNSAMVVINLETFNFLDWDLVTFLS